MLKNILNGTNVARVPKTKKDAKEEKHHKAEVSSIDTQRTSGNESVVSKKSTLSAMKRGRKKLSSMMDRLQKTSKRFGSKRKNGEICGDCTKRQLNKLNNLPFEFDDDEDDYKSAEDGEYEDGVDQENSAKLRTKVQDKKTSEDDNNKIESRIEKKIFSIGSDDKFVLPEEQCDIPTFLHTKNCDRQLIDETRRLLKERYIKNPDSFYDDDYARMLNDDWTVTRFLLRRRLDPKKTAKLMEECGRFRKQYKMSEVQLWEFPVEFHRAGGLFKFAPDRVGNITMYMRIKMYRRVPEISDVFKAFILCVLEQCDVANNGRGTAVVFDLSGCGLQNVDLGFLSWLLSSFRNYCPKGVSYILVYNLPWILNATCKLAMTWMSASNRRALRFVYGDEIENFIARENLPDYLGGTCKLNYRRVPEGSKPAIEVCDRLDMTREQAIKIRELFKEYLTDDYDKSSERTSLTAARQLDTKSYYDDARSFVLDSDNGHERSMTAVNNRHLNGDSANTNDNTSPTGQSIVPVVDLVSRASRFIAQ